MFNMNLDEMVRDLIRVVAGVAILAAIAGGASVAVVKYLTTPPGCQCAPCECVKGGCK